MTEYYNNLLKTTTNPTHRSYYEEMIKYFETHKKQIRHGNYKYLENNKKDIDKKNYRRNNIYVGSLNKTFKSARKASVALGHSKTYIYKVLYGHIPNKYNVKEV